MFRWAPLPHKHAHVSFLPQGGNYESFAYDNADPIATRFFVTEDDDNGALVRYACFLNPHSYRSFFSRHLFYHLVDPPYEHVGTLHSSPGCICYK